MLFTLDFGAINIIHEDIINAHAVKECFRYGSDGCYNNLIVDSFGQVFAVVQLDNGAIVAYRAKEWEE